MKVKGIGWVGLCADRWDATVGFYRDVMGLAPAGEGFQSDPRDAGVRFVAMKAANGDMVEVFGPGLADRELFRTPMVGFVVDDVAAARAEMEGKGAVFVGPVVRAGSWEWSYFRNPEGHVHQILAETGPTQRRRGEPG